MQKLNTKAKLTATITITLLMISALMALVNFSAQAQGDIPPLPPLTADQPMGGSLPSGVTPSLELDSIAHLSFSPNPIGINQPLIVNMWVQPPMHVQRQMIQAYVVTITKPDGTEIEIGPLDSYQGDGTQWFNYQPDMTGTWTLEFDFLGMYFPAGNYFLGKSYTEPYEYVDPTLRNRLYSSVYLDSLYYNPSSDGPYDLVVQDEQVLSWPASDLPTDYWTRPISPENREWWVIGGFAPFNGVGGGPEWDALYPNTNTYMSNYEFTPWVQGPESAHVVWRLQGTALAGIIGGETGQLSAPITFNDYSTGTSARSGPGRGGNPDILFQGRLYGEVNTVFNGEPTTVWRCTDLRTGEVIWEQPDINRPPTIVSSAFDATAVPGAVSRADRLNYRLIYLGSGMMIKYHPSNGRVTQERSITPLSSGTVYADPYVLSVQNLGGGEYRLINWTMEGDFENITERVKNNVTWPFSSLGTVDYEAGVAVQEQSISSPATGVAINARIMAANLYTGKVLWNITADVGSVFSGSTATADHGKYAVRFNDGKYHCWDLETGQHLWASESNIDNWPWNTFGTYSVTSAYGFLYDNTYAGIRAIDWETGKIAWIFIAPTPYAFENPYEGRYSWFSGNWVADGKLYSYNYEHSPTAPLQRGWRTFCINATTGENIWNITGSIIPGLIGDGYLVGTNWYDGYMYCFGKGKSETTVTAPDTAVPLGTSLVIKGSVLDMSPAQPDTPCVSVESMATQMEYLHMQMPIDGIGHDQVITGVPVLLTAIDSDGSVIDLGTVTTNGYYGTFSKTWAPSKEGDYTIIAQFAGDASYGSSSAGTNIAVGPAPAGEVTPEPGAPTTQPIISTEAVIIIGVVVIAAVAIIAYVLMRRPKQ